MKDVGFVDAVELVDVAGPLDRIKWEFWQVPRLAAEKGASVVLHFSNFIPRELPLPQLVVLRSRTFFSTDYASQPRRGLYQNLRYYLGRWVSRKTIQRAAAAFSISYTQKDDIVRAFGSLGAGMEVNYLGVSVPNEVARSPRPSREEALAALPVPIRDQIADAARMAGAVLLNVAHYYHHKNFLTLLQAMDLLSRRDANARLVITGGLVDYRGPGGERERREVALARELSRRGVLVDLGPVSKECVWPLLRLADVFIFPSSLESFGHPLLEAMAVDTPVVASDTPIHREICGSAAVFHEVHDPSSLAAAVDRVLNDSTLRRHLINAGRSNVSRFSWEAHVHKLADTIVRVRSDAKRVSPTVTSAAGTTL